MSILLELIAQTALAKPMKKDKNPEGVFMDERWNVHVDGNSIFAKWIYPAINEVGELGQYFKKYLVKATNTAVPGQTWTQMTTAISDTKDRYNASAFKNILIVGETTNSTDQNHMHTPEEVIAQTTEYIKTVRSNNQNWEIILVGTIPRADFKNDSDNILFNQRLKAVDDHMRSHYKEMGANYYVDVRERQPNWFRLRDDGFTAKFMDSLATCNSYDGVVVDRVHPVKEAREAFAKAILDGMVEYINL